MKLSEEKALKVVIIDDEADSVEALESLLRETGYRISVVGTAIDVKSGIGIVELKKPDIVFLDIRMPGGSGFDLLEQIEYRDFEVVFVTAYDEYALKAFEFAALHYLLKPVLLDDLEKVLGRYYKINTENKFTDQISIYNSFLDNEVDRILLPVNDQLKVVCLKNIVRLEAEGSYTVFHLTDQSKVVVSKTMRNYEKLLDDMQFSRIHNKHIVNLKYVKNYIRGEGGVVELDDGSTVEVSIRKKTEFLLRLKKYVKSA